MTELAESPAIEGELIDNSVENDAVIGARNDHFIATEVRKYNQLVLGLQHQRRKFVRDFVKTGNQTLAAISAGYSIRSAASQGNRLMKDEKVKAAVDAGHHVALVNDGIPKSYLRSKLVGVAEVCSEPESEKYNGLNVIRAVDSLSRLEGHNAPVESINHNLNVSVNMQFNLDIPDKE